MYIYMCVCVCVCVEKGKNGRKLCLEICLLCRRLLTSRFYLNTNIRFLSYFIKTIFFCLRNNYNR